MLLAGATAMLWLLPGQQSAAGLTFDVNTLVFAAASVVCGFQAIVFYMFAKTHAVRSGLLPDDSVVAKLRDVLRLESGLIVGLLATAAGLGLATYAVGAWGTQSFGPLNPERSLRIVIPSATLLILGLQIMFSSCLLSILQLDSRTSGARTRKTDKAGSPATVSSPADSATK
jgi:hypothetical protein